MRGKMAVNLESVTSNKTVKGNTIDKSNIIVKDPLDELKTISQETIDIRDSLIRLQCLISKAIKYTQEINVAPLKIVVYAELKSLADWLSGSGVVSDYLLPEYNKTLVKLDELVYVTSKCKIIFRSNGSSVTRYSKKIDIPVDIDIVVHRSYLTYRDITENPCYTALTPKHDTKIKPKAFTDEDFSLTMYYNRRDGQDRVLAVEREGLLDTRITERAGHIYYLMLKQLSHDTFK